MELVYSLRLTVKHWRRQLFARCEHASVKKKFEIKVEFVKYRINVLVKAEYVDWELIILGPGIRFLLTF